MADLKNKRVITAAVCGSWPTKDMNPAVPYSPQEIAREAVSYTHLAAHAGVVDELAPARRHQGIGDGRGAHISQHIGHLADPRRV